MEYSSFYFLQMAGHCQAEEGCSAGAEAEHSKSGNQPNRFPPAQPMCAATTTTNKQQCSTRLNSCNQSWQLPTPPVAGTPQFHHFTAAAAATRSRSGLVVRHLGAPSFTFTLSSSAIVSCDGGRYDIWCVCRRRMVRMDRRRSAAEADGARHRLRPVLEPRLHLVGAITCGYPKTKDDCTR